MTRTWRQRLLAAALVVLAALTGGSRATAADNLSPVVIDSPAWAELMALPLQPGEPLPFYAADLVEAWGRPVEAIQLRRALLHRHLRVAAGESFPTGGHVADVWQQARGNALSTADLMAAHDAALNRHLGFEVLASAAPGSSGSDFVPLGPQAPGFWADPQGRRLGVHLQLRNTGAVGLAPSSLLLRLSDPAPGLVLVCEPTGSTRLLPPQQSTAWWCEATWALGRCWPSAAPTAWPRSPGSTASTTWCGPSPSAAWRRASRWCSTTRPTPTSSPAAPPSDPCSVGRSEARSVERKCRSWTSGSTLPAPGVDTAVRPGASSGPRCVIRCVRRFVQALLTR